MRKEGNKYITENVTDAYLLDCMIKLNEWCREENLAIDKFQGMIITIVNHIDWINESHPFIIIQEHPDWMYELVSSPSRVSLEKIILLHLSDFIKAQLCSNLFEEGLPYMKGA